MQASQTEVRWHYDSRLTSQTIIDFQTDLIVAGPIPSFRRTFAFLLNTLRCVFKGLQGADFRLVIRFAPRNIGVASLQAIVAKTLRHLSKT